MTPQVPAFKDIFDILQDIFDILKNIEKPREARILERPRCWRGQEPVPVGPTTVAPNGVPSKGSL
jgi:hypothetical protein